MKTKLAAVVLLIVGAVSGCATSSPRLATRGRVLSESPGSRVIVAGPATVHAYAGFTGGEIYNSLVVTGADADCSRLPHGDVPIRVPADRVVSIAVPAGAVACLHTWDGGGYELLWHAAESRRPTNMAATAADRRVR
jgi:hypothetical protein